MSNPNPRPKRDRARHALLFELIRQRSMAQYVSRRNPDLPETDPSDLLLFAQAAARSIAPENHAPL
ncbi:MAG: hypothetical protein ACNA7M_12275 [Roseovarius sp.]